jgi:hypothetical protein
VEWECNKLPEKDIRYMQIWLIKHEATSQESSGAFGNDQFADIADIFAYDEGATIGLEKFMRIRAMAAEDPGESEDLILGAGEFFRKDSGFR